MQGAFIHIIDEAAERLFFDKGLGLGFFIEIKLQSFQLLFFVLKVFL